MRRLIMNKQEMEEIEYILKKEMEEIALDMADGEVECIVKSVMRERYSTLFQIFQRVTSHDESSEGYMLKNKSS